MSKSFRHAGLGAAALAALVAGSQGTQDAVANGDTRTLPILHTHTKESASITFRRNGRYDQQALDQLNWLLRDWRLDEQVKMDPRLFDIVWEVYRSVGASEPVHVVSAYRSGQTNAMLRRRSRAVAKHSQHTAGKAMDFYIPDADMARVRALAMQLQNGGVGFYPSAGNPFVHLDSGSVRAWPRMTRDQLVRLFPDGKTVHLPADGQPLPGYEMARAEILARGGSVAGFGDTGDGEDGGSVGQGLRSLFATLFGRGEETTASVPAQARARGVGRVQTASLGSTGTGEDGGTRGFFAYAGEAPSAAFPTPSRRSVQPEMQTASIEANPELSASLAPGLPGRAAALDEADAANVPTPPRRPEDFGEAVASAPIPPARPVEFASLGTVTLPQPAAAPARGPDKDDRAALRALFVAVATAPATQQPARIAPSRAKPQTDGSAPAGVLAMAGSGVAMRFSGSGSGELSASSFSGPAVKPLPVLR